MVFDSVELDHADSYDKSWSPDRNVALQRLGAKVNKAFTKMVQDDLKQKHDDLKHKHDCMQTESIDCDVYDKCEHPMQPSLELTHNQITEMTDELIAKNPMFLKWVGCDQPAVPVETLAATWKVEQVVPSAVENDVADNVPQAVETDETEKWNKLAKLLVDDNKWKNLISKEQDSLWISLKSQEKEIAYLREMLQFLTVTNCCDAAKNLCKVNDLKSTDNTGDTNDDEDAIEMQSRIAALRAA